MLRSTLFRLIGAVLLGWTLLPIEAAPAPRPAEAAQPATTVEPGQPDFVRRPLLPAEASAASGQAVPTPPPTPTVRPPEPHVVGGSLASAGQFPWVVYLEIADPSSTDGSAFICGGSLIKSDWVLTAAHCVYSDDTTPVLRPATWFTAALGKLDPYATSGGEVRAVDRVVPHPGFNHSTYSNDVALLHLKTPSAQPTLSLMTRGDFDSIVKVGTTATAMGWGTTSEGGSASIHALRYTTISVLADADCARAWGSDYSASVMLCASTTNGKDTCQGDSGGPLVVRNATDTGWLEVGIVSFGEGCANGTPAVYSFVPGLLSFISATAGLSLPNPPTPTATPPGATATPTRTPTSSGGSTGLGNLKLITPLRVVDTRSDNGGPIGYTETGSRIGSGALQASGGPRRYKLSGQTFGTTALPADITGVLVNVTITGGPTGGYLTVYSGDLTAPPNASTVNPSGQVAHNFWLTGVPTAGTYAGTIAIYSTANVQVIVDLVGYYAPSNPAGIGALKFITPVRVLDTRPSDGGAVTTTGFDAAGNKIAAGQLAPGNVARFKLAGKTFGSTAFPTDVTGILAHVTLIGSGGGGYVTLFPGDVGDANRPNASTVNPTTPVSFNTTALGLPTSGTGAGTFAVFSTASQHIAVDVMGYFAPSNTAGAEGVMGRLTFIAPSRAVDTRPDASASGAIGFTSQGIPITAGTLAAGTPQRYLIRGKAFGSVTIPSTAKGLLLNVTVVGGGGGGYVTAFPGSVPDASRPIVSTLNPSTQIAASFWANGIPDGTEALYSTAPLHAIVDIVGYFE